MLKSLFFPEEDYPFHPISLENIDLEPQFVKMATLIEQNPDFRETVKVFLELFKAYFDRTGQYLDIEGRDNIIFFKTDDKWTFRLGTVIKNETVEKFSKDLEWLIEGAKGADKDGLRKCMVDYCFHWTKILNLLGMMVGTGRIINDQNTMKVASQWNDLERTGIIVKPSDTEWILKIVEAVENHPADKIIDNLKALSIDPQKDTDILLRIFLKSSPDKKLVLAKYLHQNLPIASGPDANYSFCPIRFCIAENMRKHIDGKALALECFKDVMKDPDAPHEKVQKYINELS